MVGLRLGPLLRYVDEDTATVWVETETPCEVEVRCDAGGAGGTARTWQVAGHHYALVTVVGLEPGTETPYRVLLDGTQVWPLPGSSFPPSTIRTPRPDTTDLHVAFGSCRWAARPGGDSHDPVGPDALDALAQQAIAGGDRPDVLLLLGDQVYADETSDRLRAVLGRRRDLSEPPWSQVADYEEYTRLYDESWLDPEVRWLLSTVPSCMIFDDHDVIDDWNTSDAWWQEMRRTGWWRERILGGLTSYWVYQHLGNLSPGELADDPLFAAVRQEEDGWQALRAFAERADTDRSSVRWSFRRDFGRVRLLMVDSRAARVLDEQHRAMLDDDEMAWVREQALADLPVAAPLPGQRPAEEDGARASAAAGVPAGSPAGGAGTPPAAAPDDPAAGGRGPDGERRGGYDHLLIGTSLPWLLPPAIHHVEAWNAALCRGVRGSRWARRGERLRRAADLEHWAAFPDSFEALAELIQEVAGGPAAPATVSVLSGDVHHAYISEPRFPRPVRSRVVQLTCSPIHNSIPAAMRIGFRFGWSGLGRRLGRMLARHGRVPRPSLSWRRTGGPWFGNQLMTLRLCGRAAELSLAQARAVAPDEARSRAASTPQSGAGTREGAGQEGVPDGAARLETLLRRQLTSDRPAPAGSPARAGRGGEQSATGR